MATCSKWYVFLLVVATLLILAFILLHFQIDNNLLSSYREAYKVNHSVTILDLMALSALQTYRKPSFTLDMHNSPNCLLFYLVSSHYIDRRVGYYANILFCNYIMLIYSYISCIYD